MKSGSISHSVMSNSLQPLWTVACQAPLFMGFPRQEYWSGLPFPSPGEWNLPDPGIKPASPVLADRLFTAQPPGKSKTSLESLSNLFNIILESCGSTLARTYVSSLLGQGLFSVKSALLFIQCQILIIFPNPNK